MKLALVLDRGSTKHTAHAILYTPSSFPVDILLYPLLPRAGDCGGGVPGADVDTSSCS